MSTKKERKVNKHVLVRELQPSGWLSPSLVILTRCTVCSGTLYKIHTKRLLLAYLSTLLSALQEVDGGVGEASGSCFPTDAARC